MATHKAHSRYQPPQFDPLNRFRPTPKKSGGLPAIPQWLWLGSLLVLLVWMTIRFALPSAKDDVADAKARKEQRAEKRKQAAAEKTAERSANQETDQQAKQESSKEQGTSIAATLKAKAKALLGSNDATKSDAKQTDPADFDFTKIPGFAYPAAIPGQQIIRHRTYTLSYDEMAEQASWVAYVLTTNDVEGVASRKDDRFREDGAVHTGSSTLADYKQSGYDRGHLIPAADRRGSEADLAETFYLSNVSPQIHSMNAGIWEHAERQVRNWAKHYGKVYVTTGPCLKPMPQQKIGPSNVAVPDYFYKVVLVADGKQSRAIAFFIPNASSKKPLSTFVMSVDDAERKTGLDFYPLLPDDIEDRIEAEADITRWP